MYIFSGTKVIAEYTPSAATTAPTKEYIYSGAQLLATLDASHNPTYRQADHLSARLFTDASGNVIGTQGHLPFGEGWYLTGTVDKWKFTTYERDSDTNLDYAIMRFDSARLARFMSPDPYDGSANPGDPQSWNRYAYVVNDPVNAFDPLGLWLDGRPIKDPDDPPPPPPDDSITLLVPWNIMVTLGQFDDVHPRLCRLFGIGCGGSPPAKNVQCPTVPEHPGYANVNANMNAAKSAPFAVYSFYNQVRNHGPWDYKQAKNLNDFGQIIPHSPFEDFGNFNYGATSASLGLPLNVALRAAGYGGTKAATGSTWDAIKGALGPSPYGDDSHDQEMIINGYNFSKQGCHE